ncbi:MAG: cation:proton antiporter [Clostridiaceae bacterium]|nr:cation:proton antiporter [Clostridiaceae bacterium]
MEKVFLDIAIILIATKIGGMVSKKFNMPQVLGALISGVIIGPSLFGLVQVSHQITLLSELGVAMLMFLAGLETNINELKKAGRTSLLIAIGGIVLPLIFGTLSAYMFYSNFYENLFIGVILTATSVSISVEVLNELGKLNTRAGINILGAAVIDDVIGLLVVSFVLALGASSKTGGGSTLNSLLIVGGKVTLFCALAIVLIAFIPGLLNKIPSKKLKPDVLTIFGVAFALIIGYISENLGIAAITGAYVWGLSISSVKHKDFLADKVKTISSYLLTPIFFASIGLAVNLQTVDSSILLLTILLFITAILGKILGCGLVAKLCGLKNSECLQIGMGMISRGEVALITTNLGLQSGIISPELFVPTLIVVIGTTLITPIALKLAFSRT